MQKIKKTSYALLISFAVFIWGYSLVDAFMPNREYSGLENRYLAQAPVFSFRSLFNNTYTLKVEEFTNDQFMMRDGWITVKSLCETALLKIENNGVVYGDDGFMFEKRLNYDADRLGRNLDSVIEFARKYPGVNKSLMIVPTSDMILADKLPRGLHNVDQKPIIDDIYARAEANGINTVDVYNALREDYLEYGADEEYPVYYRTDHHWTTDSAFEAFRQYGFNFISSHFPGAAGYVPDFYGTYYSKAKLFSAKPDTIKWYDIPVKSVTINGVLADGIYDREKFELRDKYAAFLHGNNGITVIESDATIRRYLDGESGETRKILLFKDSFGNSFAPFLCYAFDEVTVVDLRYFTTVEKLMAENNYDEILILYSFPTFSQETSIVNLKI